MIGRMNGWPFQPIFHSTEGTSVHTSQTSSVSRQEGLKVEH